MCNEKNCLISIDGEDANIKQRLIEALVSQKDFHVFKPRSIDDLNEIIGDENTSGIIVDFLHILGKGNWVSKLSRIPKFCFIINTPANNISSNEFKIVVLDTNRRSESSLLGVVLGYL